VRYIDFDISFLLTANAQMTATGTLTNAGKLVDGVTGAAGKASDSLLRRRRSPAVVVPPKKKRGLDLGDLDDLD
jgi:cell division septum initiation protein DivIVA